MYIYVLIACLFPQFLAIIAFSLVAGFSVETTFNIACNPSQLGDTFNYTVKSSYSFGYINGIEESFRNGTLYRSKLEASVGRGVQQNAQFFVTWGVFTMFYCIIALLVYMLVTANEQWEKAFDFLVFTVRTVFCMALKMHEIFTRLSKQSKCSSPKTVIFKEK